MEEALYHLVDEYRHRCLVPPLTLLRTPEVPLMSAHEKVPFAVTPVMPYIKYSESSAQTPSREASGSLR